LRTPPLLLDANRLYIQLSVLRPSKRMKSASPVAFSPNFLVVGCRLTQLLLVVCSSKVATPFAVVPSPITTAALTRTREFRRPVVTTTMAPYDDDSSSATCPSRTILFASPPTAAAVAATTATAASATASRYLVRVVFLRAAAFVHAVAFLVAIRQNAALIGDDGITPARRVLDAAEERGRIKKERRLAWRKQQQQQDAGARPAAQPPPNADDPSRGLLLPLRRLVFSTKRAIGNWFDSIPFLVGLREVLWDRCDGLDRPVTTLLWLAKDRSNGLNRWLGGVAWTGFATSLLILALGAANVPMVLALWLCQRSIMAVGGPWYGFGWEPQLAELSFHTLFLVPLWAVTQLPNWDVPVPVNFAVRWMLFRIMLGAGLIKLKSGDSKWKDLTTMDHFYGTQPVPNPLTRYFHWMPPWWHKLEVLTNHFVEVVAPILLLLPATPLTRNWLLAGGMIQLVFQAILISSGNLSFLNWLTMVPAIMCLDDAFVGPLLFSDTMRAAAAAKAALSSNPMRRGVSWAFLVFIMYLSIPVIKNLCSRRQVMNGSFDPLRLVNTYGAFGVVSTDRDEFIISSAPTMDGPWKEYEFPVKPGNPYKKPRFISPYHFRLDWMMWIAAACRRLDRSPWMFKLLIKLLQQDQAVVRLLADDPWAGTDEKPKYIRIDRYRYKFHKRQAGEEDPPYWDREYQGRVYPRQGVATIDILKDEVKSRHW